MNHINCPHCGESIITQVEYKKPEPPQPKKIQFYHNGIVCEAMAVPTKDPFYAIVGGKWNGNYVHIFDIITPISQR